MERMRIADDFLRGLSMLSTKDLEENSESQFRGQLWLDRPMRAE